MAPCDGSFSRLHCFTAVTLLTSLRLCYALRGCRGGDARGFVQRRLRYHGARSRALFRRRALGSDCACRVQASHEDADAIVVNTCAFVEEVCLLVRVSPCAFPELTLGNRQAKQESISAIFEAAGYKKDGKARRVIVTGCLAQRYAGELAAELPEARRRCPPAHDSLLVRPCS